DYVHRTVHFALVRGDIDPVKPTLVRVHLQNTLSDVMGLSWHTLGWPLRSAMRRIAEEGGVLVVLRPEEKPADIAERFRQACRPPGLPAPAVGAQILHGVGARRLRVLSAQTRRHGISGFAPEVVEYAESD